MVVPSFVDSTPRGLRKIRRKVVNTLRMRIMINKTENRVKKESKGNA